MAAAKVSDNTRYLSFNMSIQVHFAVIQLSLRVDVKRVVLMDIFKLCYVFWLSSLLFSYESDD